MNNHVLLGIGKYKWVNIYPPGNLESFGKVFSGLKKKIFILPTKPIKTDLLTTRIFFPPLCVEATKTSKKINKVDSHHSVFVSEQWE